MQVLRTLVLGVTVALISIPVSAGELINYQGRLTDDSGDPVVDDLYQMTFSFYNAESGGTLLWSETHPSVQTKNGLFNVILGSVGQNLDAAVFENDSLYLEIAVFGEVISPRTRMTSTPMAVSAKRITGDLQTGSGYLNMSSSSGEIAISMTAEERGGPAAFRMYNPDEGYTGQTLIQVRSEQTGGSMEFYPAGDYPPDPAIRFGIEPSPFRPGVMEFLDPSGSYPHDPYIRMGLDPSPFRSGYFEMYDPGSGWTDGPLVKMGVEPSPFHTASLRMYNPEIGPPPKLLELEVNDSTGNWESFFNMYATETFDFPDGRNILSMSASPTSGASIRMCEPDEEDEILAINAMPSGGGSLRMFNPQTEPPAVYVDLSVDPASGPSLGFFDDIGQVMGFDPTSFNEGFNMRLIDPVDKKDLFVLSGNHVSDQVSMVFTEPLSQKSMMALSSAPSTGASLRMFKPQPEPPAVLFEVRTELAGRGGGVVMELTDTLGERQTKLEPGRVKVGDAQDDNMPRSELNAGADTVTFFLQGNSSMSLAPMIGMMSSSTEAKLAIGTNAPSAELHVVGDICYTGTIGACSDARYKEHIQDISGALETILAIRGVKYDWKVEDYPLQRFDDQTHIGFLAQEVKDLIPEIVIENDDGYLSIDYSRLTPVLVEAVKEQQTTIDDLKEQVEALSALVEKLIEKR